jgi:DNA-binding transcriptional LysR family regulator
LELRHLRYFCAVAEALNFSRAAEKMRVAQPSLSRQIRDLEHELGFPLFVRTTTSVRLTDAGAHFHTTAQKLLAQLSIAVTGAREVANGRSGDFNIASDWRIPMNLIPETVRKFRLRHPKVAVHFADLQIADQIEALRAGKIHLGFVPEMAIGNREDLGLMHVHTAQLVVLLSSAHRLAGRQEISLRELAGEPWVNVDDGSRDDFRTFLTQLCRPAGYTPKMGRSTTSAGGIASLVAAGEGIALVPQFIVPNDSGGLCAMPSDCPPMEMYAVWLKRAPSLLVERFTEVLRGEVKKLRQKPSKKDPLARKSKAGQV